MDKYLIEGKLYQLMDQFKEKINHREFFLVLIENIYPFYDGNGKTCKMLFANNFN